jgi:hypothetical protein
MNKFSAQASVFLFGLCQFKLKQNKRLLGLYCSYERNSAKTGAESSLQAISVFAALAGRWRCGKARLRRANWG